MLLKLVTFTIMAHRTLCDLVVQLPAGKIRGRKDISLNRNVNFYSFLQIPYGEPPIGKLRFMSPKPVEKWDGILDCTRNTKLCYQIYHHEPFLEEYQTEDCLNLNVYTPVKPGSNASLPVLFHIHGGGFIGGHSFFDKKGPHYFMEDNVIIVSVFYRLGPFGFLSTSDEIIPGNFGLKDQHLALKWVQNNIHLFGGDPNKVTIFGQSAGASSVSYQLLSKKSIGLFRGAIAQSGSSITCWAYQRNARAIAYQLAALIDPNFNKSSSSQDLLSFLQSVDGSVLQKASQEYNNNEERIGNAQIFEGFFFAPVVEPDVEDAFITKLMYESIAEGTFNPVPLLIGFCSEEAIGEAKHIDHFKDTVKKIEEDLANLVIGNFHIKDISQKRLVGNLTRNIYTDGLFVDDLPAAVRYFSDTTTTRSVIRHAQLQSNYTDVFFYQFSYHGKLGQNNVYLKGADRVSHSEDNKYLWCSKNISNIADHYPQNDVTTLERYIRLFTNFAKYLNPTPHPEELLQNITWPKFLANNLQYLNINDSLEVKENPRGNVYSKWIDLYEKYGVKPFDTY